MGLVSILFVLLLSFTSTLIFGKVSLKDSDLKAKLVVKGLNNPTSMIFLDKDNLLVLEKNGLVKQVRGYETLGQPVLDLTSIVNNTRERGLLGIVKNDNSTFSNESSGERAKVFLYFTENIPNDIHDQCDMKNCTTPRVVNSLYEYEFYEGSLVNPQLLFSIPFGNTDIGIEHIGGKIAMGPDQRIYITGGDGHPCISYERCRESIDEGFLNSKTSNLNGSEPIGTGGILVLSQGGNGIANSRALGNNYPLNLYYAYGIRNSFGLDFDPVTGYLWDTENGPFFGDEINLVEPGFNSGWAKAQGIWSIEDYDLLATVLQEGYFFPKDDMLVNNDSLVDFNGNGKYSSPEFTWNKSVGATALKFFKSDKLGKAYQDDLFVASYSFGRIYHFNLDKDRTKLSNDESIDSTIAYDEKKLRNFMFAKGFGPRSITDLQVSPDGYLYVLTFDGSIWKIIRSNTD